MIVFSVLSTLKLQAAFDVTNIKSNIDIIVAVMYMVVVVYSVIITNERVKIAKQVMFNKDNN